MTTHATIAPVAAPKCIACGHSQHVETFDAGPPPIVRCRGCGFMWTLPDHSAAEQDGYYAQDYIASEERAEHDFGAMRRATLSREAAMIRALRPGGGRLLDVGCASGEFLRHFAGCPGWAVEGLEPSAFAVQHARRGGLTVHEGTLTTHAFPAASYDVATALDVISFWRDPDENFAALRRLLAPGGLLAVEIPCLRFRLLKNSGPVCRVLYGRRVRLNQRLHLFFYSRRTLGAVVARHGFREIAVHPEQSPLYGTAPLRALNHAFYALTGGLYRVSGGRVPLVPKEFILYRAES